MAVATRYRGRIRYWEIWNEPNDPNFLSGSQETLVAMAAEAYGILKAIDPANVVVSPGFVDFALWNDHLALGGGAWCEVVAYHFYVDRPEELTLLVPNAKFILARHGLAGKLVWNTEAGWFSGPDLGDEVEAAYVARSHLVNRIEGVERFFFYEWDRHVPGGVDLSPPPVYEVPTPAGVFFARLEIDGGWTRHVRFIRLR